MSYIHYVRLWREFNQERTGEDHTEKVTYEQRPIVGKEQVMHNLRQEHSEREKASTEAVKYSLCRGGKQELSLCLEHREWGRGERGEAREVMWRPDG